MPTVYLATRDALLSIEDPVDDPTVREHLADHEPECVSVHPDEPDCLFCGTFDAGLFRSTDTGETFERVGGSTIDPGEDPETAERRGAGGISLMSIAIDPSDPDRVWVGTEPSALFRSSDGGETWTEVGDIHELDSASEWSFPPRPYTHHVRWLEIDPHDARRVYVGIEAGAFLLTTDGGETWIDRPPGSQFDNHTLSTHPDAEGRVYSAAGDGYAESRDGAESWDAREEGLDHRYVWGLAVDAGDPDRVLVSAAHGAGNAHGHGGAANADAYVYRSDGESWERVDGGLPQGEGVLRSVLAAGDPGEFYAANNQGLFRSTDGGVQWQRLDVDIDGYVDDSGARAMTVVR